MNIRKLALALLAGSLLLVTPTRAIEWLAEAELEEQCAEFLSDGQSRGGALCIAFIQGFLAGADATDGIVADRIRRTGDSFSDRAIRNRIGSRLEQYGASYYAGYCISKDVQSSKVIGEVIDYLGKHPDEPGITANQAVYMALVERFPCED